KHIGSKLFIERLIHLNGMGLIATHDVRLGEMENDFPGRIMNKCFEAEIDGDEIRFDYVLREGINSKMNAEHLMKNMGIV
ncbi:MAG: DNA mismatch repair protein MutS, partial [Bacteroidales bacterium]